MGKFKKKTVKKKWNFEQFEIVKIISNDANTYESWRGLGNAEKLGDAEIKSYGMSLKVRWLNHVFYTTTEPGVNHFLSFYIVK